MMLHHVLELFDDTRYLNVEKFSKVGPEANFINTLAKIQASGFIAAWQSRGVDLPVELHCAA